MPPYRPNPAQNSHPLFQVLAPLAVPSLYGHTSGQWAGVWGRRGCDPAWEWWNIHLRWDAGQRDPCTRRERAATPESDVGTCEVAAGTHTGYDSKRFFQCGFGVS